MLVRLALALASFALVLGAGGAYLHFTRSQHHGTVAIVEGHGMLSRMLAKRAREVPPSERAPVVRQPLSHDVAQMFFPFIDDARKKCVYDPVAYFVNRSNARETIRFAEYPGGKFERATNGSGLRDDVEVRSDSPALRILVTGDSHTEGVVPNRESFANVLEELLAAEQPERSVEVLNAGCGAYGFHNYAGVLDKFLSLEPDVFVMTVYGGNDFVGVINLHRYFKHLPPSPQSAQLDALQPRAFEVSDQAVAQALRQVAYFHYLPEEVEVALSAAHEITLDVERICRERNIRFICAYLPSLAEVQPDFARELLEETLVAYGIPPVELERAGEPGRRYLEEIRAAGIEVVDLGDVLGASREPAYWLSDFHLSVRGHELVAQELARFLRTP